MLTVIENVRDIRTGEITGTISVEVQSTVEAAAYTAQIAAEGNNDAKLRTQALDALANLRAYRDLASPTNAQTVAAVKLLCRVCIGLIRLALRKLDATD